MECEINLQREAEEGGWWERLRKRGLRVGNKVKGDEAETKGLIRRR